MTKHCRTILMTIATVIVLTTVSMIVAQAQKRVFVFRFNRALGDVVANFSEDPNYCLVKGPTGRRFAEPDRIFLSVEKRATLSPIQTWLFKTNQHLPKALKINPRCFIRNTKPVVFITAWGWLTIEEQKQLQKKVNTLSRSYKIPIKISIESVDMGQPPPVPHPNIA